MVFREGECPGVRGQARVPGTRGEGGWSGPTSPRTNPLLNPSCLTRVCVCFRRLPCPHTQLHRIGSRLSATRTGLPVCTTPPAHHPTCTMLIHKPRVLPTLVPYRTVPYTAVQPPTCACTVWRTAGGGWTWFTVRRWRAAWWALCAASRGGCWRAWGPRCGCTRWARRRCCGSASTTGGAGAGWGGVGVAGGLQGGPFRPTSPAGASPHPLCLCARVQVLGPTGAMVPAPPCRCTCRAAPHPPAVTGACVLGICVLPPAAPPPSPRRLPHAIVSLHVQGPRIYVGDAQESLHLMRYKKVRGSRCVLATCKGARVLAVLVVGDAQESLHLMRYKKARGRRLLLLCSSCVQGCTCISGAAC